MIFALVSGSVFVSGRLAVATASWSAPALWRFLNNCPGICRKSAYFPPLRIPIHGAAIIAQHITFCQAVRFKVPKGLLRITRHFNAGFIADLSQVPQGRPIIAHGL
jgi:hypothetical protein